MPTGEATDVCAGLPDDGVCGTEVAEGGRESESWSDAVNQKLTRPEWALWLILATLLFILADVAPSYHITNARLSHDVYNALGGLVLLCCAVKWSADREA
jgi:hypothetical protein